MSWTQGQHNRVNQSPFIDPAGGNDERNTKPASSSSYTRSNVQRTDSRGDYNQRTPSQAPRTPSMPRDVAATFTQEGLQTFSMIFSSAVEAAMAKSLPDLIEKSVERKMQEVMNQFLLEMNRMKDEFTLLVQTKLESATESLSTLAQPKEEPLESPESFEEPMNHVVKSQTPTQEPAFTETVVKESASPQAFVQESGLQPSARQQSTPVTALVKESVNESVNESASLQTQPQLSSPVQTVAKETTVAQTAPSQTIVAPGSSRASSQATKPETNPETTAPLQNKADVERVVEALRNAGDPVTTDQLRSLLPDLPWGTNPSVKMNGFIRKSGGLIERAGRGLYQLRKQAAKQ